MPLYETKFMISTMMTSYLILISSKNLTLITENFNICSENMILMMVLTMVWMLLMMMSMNKNSEKEKKTIKNCTIIILMSTMLAFMTSSSFMFILMMEMSVMPMTYLILTSSKEWDKYYSTALMVAMNVAMSVPFMMYSSWSKETELSNSPTKMMSLLLMTMYIMLTVMKTPLFMSHLWLTKAHVSASGNCSMILASIMIKLGTWGMLKFYEQFTMVMKKMKSNSFSVFLVTSIMMSMTMLRYMDNKLLIAMSSVLHMGLMFPMIMMNKSMSICSAIMMMSGHGIVSYYLFYLITLKYEMMENRSTLTMKSISSSSIQMSMTMILFVFLNLGMPPLINFYSEMMTVGMSHLNSKLALIPILVSMILALMFTMHLITQMIYFKSSYKNLKEGQKKMMINNLFYLGCLLVMPLAM